MPDFKCGKIYKISSPNHDLCYIGSTTHPCLAQRWAAHNYHCRNHIGNCTSLDIIRAGGAAITLLERYPCETSQELRQREDYWISQFDNTINRNRSYLSHEDKKRINREKQKERYHNDPEYKAYKKQYYQDNREACLKRVRAWMDRQKQK